MIALLLAWAGLGLGQEAPATPQTTLVLVVGAPGTPEYGVEFADWAAHWEAAAAAAGARAERVGPGAAEEGEGTDRERLQALLASLESAGPQPVWLVFLGHGTFDGERAKLNLRGPDVSAVELAGWLAPIERPTAVLVCASCSGPFVRHLSRPGRVVVSATRSGDEYSYSRFGGHLAAALTDLAADLDKDDQVSLLEAYLFACAGVAEFYEGEARLATEHALLDDNGDGLGTPAGWFRGVRATERAEEGRVPDGVRAHQLHLVASDRERAVSPDVRHRRDELELELEALRARKPELDEDAYYAALEEVLLRLARLYEE